ncbi:MAG: hypothetical protein IJX97_03560 [Clostridia bacterium]|nr:hypothetical protein [Clostridia bacterium]
MKKTPYNVIIFIFHIITITLLTALCIEFNIINFDLVPVTKGLLTNFFQNDYVINISCTIITAIALYIIQIHYCKRKLRNDFRCNEIIRDVFDGIERTLKLTNEAKSINEEVEKLKENSSLDFNTRYKKEAQLYIDFYSDNEFDFRLSNNMLMYHNNWILIDSVQTVFFININFKLLNIVNNIKNRKPNLEKAYPEIQEMYEAYKENSDDASIRILGDKIKYFLLDIEFMAKYWYSLLNYLGYDPMPSKMQLTIFKTMFKTDEEQDNFFRLPISEQNKTYRKIQKMVKKEYFKYKIKNFFKH